MAVWSDVPRRRSLRLPALAGAAALWLVIGLIGAFSYLHGYALYRGFAPPKTPVGVVKGTVRQITFRSPAVGRTSHALIYLPPGYAAAAAHGRRFPALYLLHGAPGQMHAFTDVADLQVAENVLLARHRMRPMILVMPEGKPGVMSSDTEWANTPSGRWMSYVLDVVRTVDHRFATVAARQGRGIAGLSEGGYGAMNIALHEPGMFSVVQSWSGYFTQTASGVFRHATPVVLRDNSPAAELPNVAPRLRRLGLRVWLYQGSADATNPAFMLGMARDLRAAGAHVRLALFPGGHDWALWRAEGPRMLMAASAWFGQPARPAPWRVPHVRVPGPPGSTGSVAACRPSPQPTPSAPSPGTASGSTTCVPVSSRPSRPSWAAATRSA